MGLFSPRKKSDYFTELSDKIANFNKKMQDDTLDRYTWLIHSKNWSEFSRILLSSFCFNFDAPAWVPQKLICYVNKFPLTQIYPSMNLSYVPILHEITGFNGSNTKYIRHTHIDLITKENTMNSHPFILYNLSWLQLC